MSTDQTINYKQPPAAPGTGSQMDENLVILFMWPKYTNVRGQLTIYSMYTTVCACSFKTR